MRPSICTTTIAIGIPLAVVGCGTWQQTAYYTGQAWQRNECQKLNNEIERRQCMKEAEASYEDYQRLRQSEESEKH